VGKRDFYRNLRPGLSALTARLAGKLNEEVSGNSFSRLRANRINTPLHSRHYDRKAASFSG
jgi:hypothetical protein